MTESINKLIQAANNVVKETENLISEKNAEVFSEAPKIVHDRLCSEFVYIMKQNNNKVFTEIPEAREISNAIDVLEKFYPSLKEK